MVQEESHRGHRSQHSTVTQAELLSEREEVLAALEATVEGATQLVPPAEPKSFAAAKLD